MRRLNVRQAQIDECIQKSMFALHVNPQSPALIPGELLLLQLVKNDAIRLHKEDSRIDFALVFERIEPDYDGNISRLHWPKENRVWPWIIYCTTTVPTIPFSLEKLPISAAEHYQGQDNARYIRPEDERIILQYIQWPETLIATPSTVSTPSLQVIKKFGQKSALSVIRNYDRIARLRPIKKRQISAEQFVRNEWLSDSLKVYYEYCCQVCGKSFMADYGEHFAETHHIHYLAKGGLDTSENMIVVCPNHHRIIHATNAQFSRPDLSYLYPNGLSEKLVLSDHLASS